jgi:solute carrier family 35 protein
MKYKDFNIQTAAAVIPLSFFFFAMVVTGLGALRYVNVPMFGAIRRLTTLIVILGEGLILHKQYPKDEAWSVYLMVLGAFIAGLGDLTFHLLGYILCLLNCVVTAGYLVYIAKIKNETLLDTFGMMFYNNLLSIPFVLVAVVFTELEDILAYPLWQDFGFLICFLMSSLQAFLLNYFIFLCSTANSPLTTSVTGQIKNIFTTVIGLFLFGDVQFSVLLSLGLLIATLASMWYTHIKYQQQVQQEKAKQASYPTSHIITPPRIPNNRDD